MYEVKPTSRFKKDMKNIAKRGYDIRLIEQIVKTLAKGKPLASKHRDHAMSGKWAGHRNCHITPDWILLYKIEHDILVLTLTRTGTHSDLEI
jgi:mRNA interferase YafQ